MKMMNRAILLLATMAATLMVGSGVALAASTIHCPNDTSQGSPSDFLYCYGTSMADAMYGGDLRDMMWGNSASDTMHGYGAEDTLEGGNGSDHLYGDAGDDNSLWGGALNVNNNTYTDKSDDYVHGGIGDDTIYGGDAQGGVDRLYGEGGNDFIDASQRRQSFSPLTKEIIDCGPGANDTVYFDKGLDVVTNCEIRYGSS